MTRTREVFLAPQFADGAGPAVSRVRSTLLSASVTGVRAMGWEKRYFEALPPALHDEMRMMTAGSWAPLEIAMAHYTACDQMGLSSAEIEEMGRAVSIRTQKTFVGTLGSVAAGAGATPWTVFQHSHRIWARIFEGGDHVIYKAGPKDMDVVCSGCALLRLKYFRTAISAYYAAIAGLVAKSVHSRVQAERGMAETTVAFRLSWV
jgi:hypothetical protein